MPSRLILRIARSSGPRKYGLQGFRMPIGCLWGSAAFAIGRPGEPRIVVRCESSTGARARLRLRDPAGTRAHAAPATNGPRPPRRTTRTVRVGARRRVLAREWATAASRAAWPGPRLARSTRDPAGTCAGGEIGEGARAEKQPRDRLPTALARHTAPTTRARSSARALARIVRAGATGTASPAKPLGYATAQRT